MSTPSKTFLTPEQYLEIERKAEFRHEYREGERVERAVSNEAHVLLVGNIAVSLNRQLRSRRPQVYMCDMRVRVNASLYAYPDVAVACESEFLDAECDTLLNPTLIVEVLSESTEAYDRGKKFSDYRTLESLQEYVLVSQDSIQVECYKRQPGGRWLMTVAERLEDTVALESIGCTLRLADIYEDVELPA